MTLRRKEWWFQLGGQNARSFSPLAGKQHTEVLDFLLCEEYQKLTQNQGKWIRASAYFVNLCDIRHCILMAVAVAGDYTDVLLLCPRLAVGEFLWSTNITWTALFENRAYHLYHGIPQSD